MATRTVINPVVADYNGAALTVTTGTCRYQYKLKDSRGKNQILFVGHGEEDPVTIEFKIPYRVEDRYDVEPYSLVLASNFTAFSERPTSVFGNTQDGGSGTDYLFLDVWVNDKLAEGDTIDVATEYCVMSGPVTLDSVVYATGDTFTCDSDIKTDWEAGNGSAIIAEIPSTLGLYLLNTP